MWVFEAVRVICAKSPFLHSLNVPIKMFTNSLAVLNQQTLGTTGHTHCFQTQLTESCLADWFQVDKRPVCYFFLVWIPRLGSGLMVSEIDLTFTLSLQQVQGEVHVSIHSCTNDYLKCTKCEVHDRVRKHVIRCTEKRVKRFLIFEAMDTPNKRVWIPKDTNSERITWFSRPVIEWLIMNIWVPLVNLIDSE